MVHGSDSDRLECGLEPFQNTNPMLPIAAIGMPEILIILAIVLLLFGARKLPELARSLGGSVNEFKKGMADGVEKKDSPAPRSSETPASNGRSSNDRN